MEPGGGEKLPVFSLLKLKKYDESIRLTMGICLLNS